MDKPAEHNAQINNEKRMKRGFFDGIKSSLNETKEELMSDRRALLIELLALAVGFVLSRCNIAFGARPLGITFVALLPIAVWPALIGTVIGGISSGLDGIIFAAAALVTVMLRILVSLPDKRSEGGEGRFGESLLIRICISTLGGFVVALYESLTQGLTEATLLYGLVMVILTPLLTFLLSGLFADGIGLWELFFGKSDVLKIASKERNKKYDIIFFHISSLALIFFLGLSLKDVNAFGISLSYVFSAFIMLIVARRFGALRAMACGFMASLGISATAAVSFALAGLGAGVLAGFGSGYAIIAGGVALSAWSAYSLGLSGLLGVLPEYFIASAIVMPIIGRVQEKPIEEVSYEPPESAADMVGTMALAYQSEYSGELDTAEATLSEISRVISEHTTTPLRLSTEEYRSIVIEVASRHCMGCGEARLCARENIRPVIKHADAIAEMLSCGRRIEAKDVSTDTEFCAMSEDMAVEINREVGRREQEGYTLCGAAAAEEYGLAAGLISRMRAEDLAEKTVDNSMTEALTAAFESCGFTNGVIRAFGKRRKHFILAGEDENGAKISSFELRKSIENAANVRLDTPEYFRRGKMVLMECGIKRKYKASFAIATAPGSEREVSGDTAICFESDADYFYSLISDGMGSGEVAKETSEFVGDFIKRTVNAHSAKDTLLHILNRAIRTGREECSATVDLFELDLLCGSGTFLKSGAAPSYVKRESSIFRIKSQTAPIGLLSTIDTEKTSVEIRPGDHIFMFSDGVAEISEEAPWLLLLLGESPIDDLTEYARLILHEAEKNSKSKDDISVCVIRIDEN